MICRRSSPRASSSRTCPAAKPTISRPAAPTPTCSTGACSPPEAGIRGVSEYLGVPFEPGAINYGEHEHESKGLGDPLGVQQHSRPVTDSVEKWAHELAGDPAKLAVVRDMVGSIADADLET